MARPRTRTETLPQPYVEAMSTLFTPAKAMEVLDINDDHYDAVRRALNGDRLTEEEADLIADRWYRWAEEHLTRGCFPGDLRLEGV